MIKPKSGNKMILQVLPGMILGCLLLACGNITEVPLAGNSTPSATTVPNTFTSLPTSTAIQTATLKAATSTKVIIALTPALTVSPTPVSSTAGATGNNLIGTVKGVTTIASSSLNNPLATPILKVNNGVTAVSLESREAELKATGFDGNSAKALLDDLVTNVGNILVETPGELKTLEWLEQKFRLMGYSQIIRQSFSGPVYPYLVPTFAPQLGRPTPDQPQTPFLIKGNNLIVTRPGRDPTSKILILGGHHDTVANTVGANDNGSGMATLLEIARIFMNRYPNIELRFVAFGSEEAGLVGSVYYVKTLSEQERARVIAYINLDTLGAGENLRFSGTPKLVSQAIDLMGQVGIRSDYISLREYRSDHIPFHENKINAIALFRWKDLITTCQVILPTRFLPKIC